MKPTDRLLLTFGWGLLIGSATTHAVSDPPPAAYEKKVRFREGQAIRFPDFELTFAGRRHVVPPQFPHGWWAYDFVVRRGGKEQKISWSAGTGDIGPTVFSAGLRRFGLELSRSDRLGPLKEDELVVSPAR